MTSDPESFAQESDEAAQAIDDWLAAHPKKDITQDHLRAFQRLLTKFSQAAAKNVQVLKTQKQYYQGLLAEAREAVDERRLLNSGKFDSFDMSEYQMADNRGGR